MNALKIMADGSQFAEPVSTSPEVTVTTYSNPMAYASMEDQRAAEREATSKRGAFAWGLLHRYRGCDPQWLELWQYFIPAGGCGCKEGYKAIIEQHPPDFTSPAAFFEWGIRLHNAVNAKINAERSENRRIYTMEEAYQEWRQHDGDEALGS